MWSPDDVANSSQGLMFCVFRDAFLLITSRKRVINRVAIAILADPIWPFPTNLSYQQKHFPTKLLQFLAPFCINSRYYFV